MKLQLEFNNYPITKQIPLAVSIAGGLISLVSFLFIVLTGSTFGGNPQEAFGYGLQFLLYGVAILLAAAIFETFPKLSYGLLLCTNGWVLWKMMVAVSHESQLFKDVGAQIASGEFWFWAVSVMFIIVLPIVLASTVVLLVYHFVKDLRAARIME